MGLSRCAVFEAELIGVVAVVVAVVVAAAVVVVVVLVYMRADSCPVCSLAALTCTFY
jgi:hypothetical protein